MLEGLSQCCAIGRRPTCLIQAIVDSRAMLNYTIRRYCMTFMDSCTRVAVALVIWKTWVCNPFGERPPCPSPTRCPIDWANDAVGNTHRPQGVTLPLKNVPSPQPHNGRHRLVIQSQSHGRIRSHRDSFIGCILNSYRKVHQEWSC